MTSPETAPESLPPGETFDPTKPFTTRDGREVMGLHRGQTSECRSRQMLIG